MMSYIARVIVKTTTISFVPLSERTQLKTVGTWPRRCLEDDLVAYLLAIIARLVGWEPGAIDILLVRIGNKFVGSQDAVLVLAVWRKTYCKLHRQYLLSVYLKTQGSLITG